MEAAQAAGAGEAVRQAYRLTRKQVVRLTLVGREPVTFSRQWRYCCCFSKLQLMPFNVAKQDISHTFYRNAVGT